MAHRSASSKAAPPHRSSALLRKGSLLLAAVVVLLVSVSLAWPWLLERAPDAFLRSDARWCPGDPRPDVILGERLLALGQTRPAMAHFEQAAARGSQDIRLAVGLADALRAAGLYDKAAAQVRELLKIEPESGRLHRILGQCQLEMGQLSQGLASLEQATRFDPHDVDAWIALADAHLGIVGFRPETASVWEAALQQNPGPASLRYGLAETYVGLGRYPEAAALLQDLATRPAPPAPKARELYARAWASWGTVLHRWEPDAARRARARQALERALSLAPQLPDAYYELALLQAEDNQWEAARQSLEAAIRLRPYAHSFWYHLARVDRRLGLRQQGDQAEARFNLLVSSFTTVNSDNTYLDAHPEDDSRRLCLARLLVERGDRDAAALHLSLVLRDQPRNPEALRLLRRLRAGRSLEIGQQNTKTRR